MQKCPVSDKDRHPSQVSAIRAALSYSRKRGTALRIYRCSDCDGGYHLTSQPKTTSSIDNRNGVTVR